MPIPKSYDAATWRNVTELDADNSIGIGFDLSERGTVRVLLLRADWLSLFDELSERLQRIGIGSRSHSPMSSGIPSCDVSDSRDGVKV